MVKPIPWGMSNCFAPEQKKILDLYDPDFSSKNMVCDHSL